MKRWIKYMPTNKNTHGEGLTSILSNNSSPEFRAEIEKEITRREKRRNKKRNKTEV